MRNLRLSIVLWLSQCMLLVGAGPAQARHASDALFKQLKGAIVQG